MAHDRILHHFCTSTDFAGGGLPLRLVPIEDNLLITIFLDQVSVHPDRLEAWRKRDADRRGSGGAPTCGRGAVRRRGRLGPFALTVPIADVKPEATSRGILVATHDVVLDPQDVQSLRLEDRSSAPLPLPDGIGERVERFPDRHCLTC